jgi:predicted  nucleic acid-binding Zn-ribbon protein
VTGLDEDLEYECPECGTYFPAGAKRCPGCGTEFDWEGDEEETIDEILEKTAPGSIDAEEEAKKEVEEIAEPSEGPIEEEPEVSEEAIEEEYEEAPEEEPEIPEEASREEVPEELEEVPPEEILEEIPPVAPKGPKLYGGLLSVPGLAFVVLTVLALIATIIALRWDTWINGAAVETIGDHQRLYVYLGTVGIVVCAMVSVVDIFRNRKGQRG